MLVTAKFNNVVVDILPVVKKSYVLYHTDAYLELVTFVAFTIRPEFLE